MRWTPLNKMKKVHVRPYQALAPFYDHLMAHVDYNGWANYVVHLAELHGSIGRRVIDLSCGTGTICHKLRERNCTAIGCDGSKPMLIEAVRKTNFQINDSFVCSDMRHIPLKNPVDLVLSLYDSMNYLLTQKDWLSCLFQVYQILNEKGLFIFDISTIENSERAFKNYNQSETTAIGEYYRKSTFDSKNKIQYNYFKIVLYDKPNMIFFEEHRQRIFYIHEIKEMIETSPFSLLGCYADFSLQTANELAERVHFVLQK